MKHLLHRAAPPKLDFTKNTDRPLRSLAGLLTFAAVGMGATALVVLKGPRAAVLGAAAGCGFWLAVSRVFGK